MPPCLGDARVGATALTEACSSARHAVSHLQVGLKAMPFETPIGSLEGTANIMNVVSEHHPNGLVVQGAGAGDVITAAGVIADAVELAQREIEAKL